MAAVVLTYLYSYSVYNLKRCPSRGKFNLMPQREINSQLRCENEYIEILLRGGAHPERTKKSVVSTVSLHRYILLSMGGD